MNRQTDKLTDRKEKGGRAIEKAKEIKEKKNQRQKDIEK